MTHSEIVQLLPWYVNGTLSEDERSAAEVHLAQCQECSRELKQLKELESAVLGVAEQAPAPSSAGLNRVLARIEVYEKERQRAHEKRFGGLTWLSDAWTSWWQPTPNLARAVIAVQLLVILALAGMLSLRKGPGGTGETAGGPAGVQRPQEVTQISVSFVDGVSERMIRETLLNIKGRIVDGPSVLGLYTVEVPIPPQQREQVDKLIQQLQHNAQVVRFAARKE
jgi:hypothetical protein